MRRRRHVGLSRAMRWIRWRISASSFGRPSGLAWTSIASRAGSPGGARREPSRAERRRGWNASPSTRRPPRRRGSDPTATGAVGAVTAEGPRGDGGARGSRGRRRQHRSDLLSAVPRARLKSACSPAFGPRCACGVARPDRGGGRQGRRGAWGRSALTSGGATRRPGRRPGARRAWSGR
jgi:hypothetical protein